ncbi:hypothetical protein [Nonomuraea sp. NPDC046570]|uniref:hypothetical protein n=1 Tax=Nonomuraea sp. NPDC046570 TaxID=3155255 RepID=UPI0033EAE7A5
MTSLDATPRSGADTFVRYSMIACAVFTPLAIAVTLFLSPHDATAEGAAYVASFAANLDAYPAMAWIGLLSAIAGIPATLAVGRVARRGRPVLGLVGMILAFCISVPVMPNSDDVLYAALKSGLDVPTTAKLYDTLSNGTPTAVLGWIFLLGLAGFVIVGVAALLGKTAPVWASVALIVAPVLVPVSWFAGLGNVLAGVAWLVMTIGMGGVALGLLNERA